MLFRKAKGSFFVNASRSDNSILRNLAFFRFIQTVINRQIFSLILPSTISGVTDSRIRIKIFLNFTVTKRYEKRRYLSATV